MNMSIIVCNFIFFVHLYTSINSLTCIVSIVSEQQPSGYSNVEVGCCTTTQER